MLPVLLQDAATAHIKKLVTPELVVHVNAIYVFEITRDGQTTPESWTLDLQNAPGSFECKAWAPLAGMAGKQFVAASLAMTEDVFLQLVNGKLDAMWGLLSGKVSLTGSKKQAAKLQAVFSPRDASEVVSADVLPDIHRKQHITYFKRFLGLLPHFMQSQDTNRITLVFFALSGLDLLGALETDITVRCRAH